MKKVKEVKFFVSNNGKCHIEEWLKKLDIQTRARIHVRLVRLEYGNYGDYRKINKGLFELRLFFGKGHRIYFTEEGNDVVLLLNGGDKSSQDKDIKKAKDILFSLKNEVLNA